MTSYLLTYRAAKGSNLSATEFDANFHNLDDRTTVLEDLDIGVGIDHFTISGNQLSVTMSDSSVLGPYTIPTAEWNWRGEWEAGISYAALDTFTFFGTFYVVLLAHVSATSFDPGDNDGAGHDYYRKLFAYPSIPSYERTETTFTPTLDDANSYNRCTNGSGCAITIPSEDDVNFPLFTELHFRQCSDGGVVSIVEPATGSPLVINGMEGFTNSTDIKGAVFTIKKVASDEWDLFGHLAVEITV